MLLEKKKRWPVFAAYTPAVYFLAAHVSSQPYRLRASLIDHSSGTFSCAFLPFFLLSLFVCVYMFCGPLREVALSPNRCKRKVCIESTHTAPVPNTQKKKKHKRLRRRAGYPLFFFFFFAVLFACTFHFFVCFFPLLNVLHFVCMQLCYILGLAVSFFFFCPPSYFTATVKPFPRKHKIQRFTERI